MPQIGAGSRCYIIPEKSETGERTEGGVGRSPMPQSSIRAVTYARYSSDAPHAASIEDQTRLCKDRIVGKGWELVQLYRDAAFGPAHTSARPHRQAVGQRRCAGGSRS